MSPTPGDNDEDLAREIRAHLELEAEERIAGGAAPGQAHEAARRAFGNVTRIREEARAVSSRRWVEQARQDFRYALRGITRNRGFTFVALLVLALGSGATTAIFTVVHAVLLRPLPFPGSDRVVRIFETVSLPGPSGAAVRRMPALALAELAAFESQTTTLSHVGAQIPTIRTLTSREEPVRLVGVRVSPALLSMTGTHPLYGRVFGAHEDAPGAEPVVVLSYTAWQRYFGADPGVVGGRIGLDGTPHTVAGVMGPRFVLFDPQDDFWMPLVRSGPFMKQRLPITARLRDGVSPAAALAEIAAIIPAIRGQSGAPAARDANPFTVVRLLDLVVMPAKRPLLVLSVAVALVLLIACVNVANLLLSRGVARERETAVRLALGAGRGRLIRQALTESVVLAVTGGLAGLALAFAGVEVLRRLAASLPRRDLVPGVGLPRLHEVAIDGTVLAVALGGSVITGIAFGVIPAFRQTRPRTALLGRGTTSSRPTFGLRRGSRSHAVLIAVEIAMATTLVTGAALLIHSFVKLSRADPGYDPSGVVTFQIALPPGRSDIDLRRVADQLSDRLRAVPGVESVGYAEMLPMTRVAARFSSLRSTAEAPAGQRQPGGGFTPQNPDTRLVSREFLTALSARLVAGRAFGDQDRAGQPQVMLINQSLARSGLVGENPIGRTVFALGAAPWEIVGIVEDIRQAGPTEPATPQLFIDYRQVPDDEPIVGIGLYFAIGTGRSPDAIAAEARSLARQLDARAMVENVATLERLAAHAIATPRLYAVLLGAFAAVALILACSGIYGVMLYSVAQRTPEIGIRVALGAGPGRVMRLVLGQSFIVTVIGIAAGLAGTAALGRYLEQMLFGVAPLDGPTFAVVALLFATVAMTAAWIPARRAAGVDPLVTLRCE